MSLLKFAIIGKTNVGKSTLFNRLCGRKLAITSPIAGVTRDRKEYPASLHDLNFLIIDTAGWENESKTEIKSLMMEQTQAGIEDAQIILFTVDARACLSADDLDIAHLIRKHNKPTILIANKSESKITITSNELYSLGFGEPVFISAEHNLGFDALYGAIKELSESDLLKTEEVGTAVDLFLAIAGRPNVGKSTIFNKLLGWDRNIVCDEAGTTRDAISYDIQFQGNNISLIDTAGMRKKSKVHEEVEGLSLAQTITAIRRSNVVALIMDVTQALEHQDLSIAQIAINEGKGLLLVFNKCDLSDELKIVQDDIRHFLEHTFKSISNIPVIYTTATEGRNVSRILSTALEIRAALMTKLTTGVLNQWLKNVTAKHTPPLTSSGRRLKLKYMTQTGIKPPTFRIFTNISDVPGHYERYLENALRADFQLIGIPIRIQFKTTDNPYAN